MSRKAQQSAIILPRTSKAYQSVVRSNGRINLWDGAVRAGKTWASIIRWIDYASLVPKNANLLMVGKTERTLYRNIITPMQEMLGIDNVSFNIGRSELNLCGRTIYTASANDERSEEKIRGITLGGLYGDECSLWPESFFKMAMTRLSVRNSKAFLTTNPDNPYHHIKRDYIDRIDELNAGGRNFFKYFHFTLDDNATLDPLYKEALKREFTGVFYKRFVLGLWVQAEGAIYDQWDEERHAVDTAEILRQTEQERFRYHIAGIDYGTSNPSAFVLIGYNRAQGPFYVVKEFYYSGRDTGVQRTDAMYANDFQEFIQGYPLVAIYADPSAVSFATELRSRGIIVTNANNSVIDGIRHVSKLLPQGQLFVDRRCVNLIKEFAAYVWDAKAQERGEDVPDKKMNRDHALDALRYALYTHFGQGRRGVIAGIKH